MIWKVLSVIGIVLAIAFFIVALYSLVTNFQFLARAQKTDGVVVGVNQTLERPFNTPHYYPQIQFTTATDRSVTFTSDIGEEITNPNTYQQGDHVTVEYDPNNPNNAEIASSSPSFIWIDTIIWFLLGICALIIPTGLKNKFGQKTRRARAN